MSLKDIGLAVNSVKEFEEYIEKKKLSFESAGLDVLKEYLSLLIDDGKNSMERLIAIARYCYLTNIKEHYIYFTSILNARNVLPDIGKRLATIVGEDTRRKVFQGFKLSHVGSPPKEYAKFTQIIISRLETELPQETCKEILTWNYHNIPAEAFKELKERYEKANSIDEFLKDEHKRFTEELEEFMKNGKIWYEQEITPATLEFVRSNQEISTGVRHGDKIYMTKIPYAPDQYIKAKNPTLKRYYACHCPLARSAIRDGNPKISSTLCHCSSGFVKVRFDALFSEPVKIELLESVLNEDMRCRFAIKIPEHKMK